MKSSNKILYAKKVGMTQLLVESGEAVPVTVLDVQDNIVFKVKTVEKDGYNAILIGFEEKSLKRCNKPESGFFEKLKLKPVKYLKEFRVSEDHGFSQGDVISTDVFEIGDVVNVRSRSKGLGFTGSIKRWNFKRGLMTHGSKTHRIPGSIGAGTTPSRVLRGKKMAGRKGNDLTSILNLKIMHVDEKHIYVKGAVPGKKGSLVEVLGDVR